MSDKIANAQALSQGISTGFGDSYTEEAARKRKKLEDEAAAMQAQQQTTGQEPSAWDTMKAMSGDALSGMKDMASSPGAVWDAMTKGPKKKK